MKKLISVALALILVVAIVGCTKTETPKNTTPATTNGSAAPVNTPENTAEVSNLPKVTVVVAGGLGDRSFYDSANAGLEKLKAEFKLETKVLECNDDASMFQPQLVNAAESSDIVVAVGWQFYDLLKEIAPQKTNVKFIYVDEVLDTAIPNVYNVTYAQNEGSFLVGYIAAKLSKTKVIGVVGGEDTETINDFITGYKQGAKYADETIEVKTIYSNTYEDPAKGKECGLSLYDQGCDIVFGVAGKTGNGIFEAAAEKKDCYAIGVDCDQKYINPEVIICSMIKDVGESIYAPIASYINNNTFKGGIHEVAGLSMGLIGVGYGEEGAVQQVSAELKAEVADIAAKISSGEIVVESARK